MAASPEYVRRFDRVTRALRILTMYPDGLPLSRLATELDVDEATLREEIVAFYRADIDPAFDPDSFRQVRIEFVGPDGEPDEVDPAEAEIVRASTEQPAAEIGVVHTSPAELANVYRAGHALLSVEPENTVLHDALSALGDTVLRGIRPSDDHWKAELAGMLLEAIERQRRVRITYLPVWGGGTHDRIIAPYRLLCTRSGWEVEAAESTDDGDVLGTYLLTSIREATILDEPFDRPADLDQRIREHRREHEVDVVVPQDYRWVADRFAESSEVVAEDEASVKLRARMRTPVEQRLGVLLLVAGPNAFVTAPGELATAGRDLARDLLDHHRQAG
ncbi:proteasome accessory factor C [Haloactinopolyspora alba]|uniref:Proteasome accessory factor C n=1 Tax=Haloactinopolyspora alba TaxID=648780 RepID=A0A2P8EGB0_9ACTN|nr:WYL domain-containing protein [Haloactinopolyspora alba]PSL08474.1 proteasome accessory factor C [Haloactinopolyspora alba]